VSRFVKDSLQTLALSGINRILGIAVGILLARSLGPAGKGTIAYTAIALELFIVVMGGVTQAVTYQLARNGIAGGTVYAAMLRIVAGIALPAVAVITAVALLVPSQHDLLWVAAALPFATYGEATIGLLLGAQQVGATNVQRVLTGSAFNLAAIVAVAVFHAGVAPVLALWVLGYIAAAAYAAVAVRPYVREGGSDAGVLRDQVRFASKSGLAGVAGYINMRIDVVVVSIVLGPVALGVYTLALGLAEMLWQISQPLCWAALGRIAIAPAGEAATFTAKLTRHIIALLVPGAIVSFICAPFVVTFVYGPAFAEAGPALRWLLPGIVAYAIEIPLGYYIMVKMGRPLLIVGIQSASILACIAITLLTVRTWGIEGAAVATSATYVTVVATKAIVFMRATGIGPVELLFVNAGDVARNPLVRKLSGFSALALLLLN
jgi:O-antigen/teichoic acid export membrane protein